MGGSVAATASSCSRRDTETNVEGHRGQGIVAGVEERQRIDGKSLCCGL
jgi:hypothetical protein